ncbi:MAG: hypothetical protein UIM27_00580 [Acutalibacteraceae bacterium]|nr:hypothetical protein [Acutalibacteraceae bacterium]
MLKSKNKLLHKALAFLLTFSLLATLVSFNFSASALEGTGTEQTPYEIASLEDLNAFANKVNNGEATNAYAKLTADITINDSWTPIGNGTNKFTGVFDGSNGNGEKYTITFTNISDNTADYVGLFGINEGTIKNVKVAGTITSGTELAFVGGVAGLNRGTITNCESSVEITANGVNSYAGGIAGVMQNGTIESCKNSGAITVHVTNKVTNDVTKQEASAGGIVAFNYNGTVKKCENTSTATIKNNETYGYTGGIVGNNDGTINNCLNGGSVTNDSAANYAGGIAGNLFTNKATGSTATISNCLNTNASGKVVGTNGTDSNAGTVTNSYYKADSESDSIDGTTAVTDDKLQSGEVTYKLNGNTAANPVWGQTISDSNTLPTIGVKEDGSNAVYPDSNNGYTNTKQEECTHENGTIEDGACDICGYTVAKLDGYNVILDGQINLKYTYTISDEYKNATITPIFKTEDNKLFEHSEGSLLDNTYTVSVYVDSDEMNVNILSSLEIEQNDQKITLNNKPYSVNKYLNSLYCNSDLSAEGKVEETKELVKAMSTYGYYANEYFAYNSHYETSVPMLELTVKSSESNLTAEKYNLSYEGKAGTLTHYASSLQHLENIAGVFYVNGVAELNNTVMEYQVVSADNKEAISGYTKQYSELNNQGRYYWAYTGKVPVQKLKDITFKVSFGTKTGETYTAQSNIKYYSPYGYIRNILKKYETSDPNGKEYKFTQALYYYSEAAYAYFNASSQS